MTYQIFPAAQGYGGGITSTDQTFPATFRYVLFSMWLNLANDASDTFGIFANNSGGTYWGINITWFALGNNTMSFGCNFTAGAGESTVCAVNSNAVAYTPGTWVNVTMSFDTVGLSVQFYLSGTAVSLSGAIIGPGGTLAGGAAASVLFEQAGCFANFYLGFPASFYDLSIAGNIDAFIDGGLPVNPGSNGQNPTGSAPLIFLTSQGSSPNDLLTNLGSGGGTWTTETNLLGWCGGGGSPVPYPPGSSPSSATLAELWFAQTPGFVNFTIEGNRRNFISDTGGARSLGTNGSAPFGLTPQVYLTRTGTAPTFATNNGRGGPFIASGASLTTGATNPPASSSANTVLTGGPAGPSVLGDYRNGNLYAFNPATLTDNGTPRKWVRRWRALPKSTTAAVKYLSLTITMQTGIGVTPGAKPQIVLRWSDDGGYSWSDPRILFAGATGQTTQVIKFNRLGMTRRFAGSDRIFELSSTDPFMATINDAEVDAA